MTMPWSNEIRRLLRAYQRDPTSDTAAALGRAVAHLEGSPGKRSPLQLRTDVGSKTMVELVTDEYRILFSYGTPVAYIVEATGHAYRTDERWSRTTQSHITRWLAGRVAVTVPQSDISGLL